METFRIFEKIWKVGSATPTDLTVLSTMQKQACRWPGSHLYNSAID